MFRRIVLGSVTLLASAAMVYADAQSDVKAAAEKLNGAANYSFNVTPTNNAQNAAGGGGGNAAGGGGGGRRGGGFGAAPFQGKTEKDGYTWISTQGRNGTTEIIFKGDKYVIKGQDGTWQTPEELAAAMANNGGGGGRGFGRGGGGMYLNMKNTVTNAISNLDKLQNYKADGDAIDADMPDDMAKTAATPAFGRGGRGGGGGGGAAPEVTNPKGTYKFWITNGALTKVETHVTGTISFNGNDRPIDTTNTIEFKDIGSTKVDVPADAKTKLDAAATAPSAQ